MEVNTPVDTHSYVRALQDVIDEFRKGLLGRGSQVWIRLHLHSFRHGLHLHALSAHTCARLPLVRTGAGTDSFSDSNMGLRCARAVYCVMCFPCVSSESR